MQDLSEFDLCCISSGVSSHPFGNACYRMECFTADCVESIAAAYSSLSPPVASIPAYNENVIVFFFIRFSSTFSQLLSIVCAMKEKRENGTQLH